MTKPVRQVAHLDSIRFAVGTEDGPRSAWWFLRAENTGDVYASTRSLGGYLKLSLHRIDENPALDRFCQFGFTKEQIATMARSGLPPPKQKHMFRWQRPPSPSHGVLHVASIIIPTDFLNRNPPPIPTSRRKRFLFHPAPAGHASEFLLFYSLQPANTLEEKLQQIGRPIVYSEFANGETVHFVWRHKPFDSRAVHAHDWNRVAPRPSSQTLKELKAGESLPGLTAVVANDPLRDGQIFLWEVSNLVLRRKGS